MSNYENAVDGRQEETPWDSGRLDALTAMRLHNHT